MEANTSISPPLKTLLLRGWKKKCPECGKGDLYKKWLTVNDQCSSCGLKLIEDPGDLLGPLMFFDRALFLIPFITIFCFCISNPKPWLYISGGLIMIFLMAVTMPNRNGASIAFDYYIRRTNNLADQQLSSATRKVSK